MYAREAESGVGVQVVEKKQENSLMSCPVLPALALMTRSGSNGKLKSLLREFEGHWSSRLKKARLLPPGMVLKKPGNGQAG